MHIQAFFDAKTSTVSYLVADPVSHEAIIIDPVLDFDLPSGHLTTESVDAILDEAERQQFCVSRVLDTHVHADHLSGADYIRKKTGARYGVGAHIVDVQSVFLPLYNIRDIQKPDDLFDDLFEDDDSFKLGELTVKILHTPGHTPACLTYLINDTAFVGDTLFMPDFGTARTDFPGGSAATLYRSIQKILALPDDTRIFVGHDYLTKDRDHHQWETTVKQQKECNIHVGKDVTESQYVTMRENRDSSLPVPTLLIPSIQANIRAGTLPPAEDDGHSYLKIPINRL